MTGRLVQTSGVHWIAADALVDRPWPRFRPAAGLVVAAGVLGFYGSQIGSEERPEVLVETAGVAMERPRPEEVTRVESPRDFSLVISTGVCATVEWDWSGPTSGSAVNETCTTSHVLSPTPNDPIEPSSTYEVQATFTDAEGVQASFATTIETPPG